MIEAVPALTPVTAPIDRVGTEAIAGALLLHVPEPHDVKVVVRPIHAIGYPVTVPDAAFTVTCFVL
jgi:hypothetical protein